MPTPKKYYIVREHLSNKVKFKTTSEQKAKEFCGKKILLSYKEVNKPTYDSMVVKK